jgi:hypothetical protein
MASESVRVGPPPSHSAAVVTVTSHGSTARVNSAATNGATCGRHLALASVTVAAAAKDRRRRASAGALPLKWGTGGWEPPWTPSRRDRRRWRPQPSPSRPGTQPEALSEVYTVGLAGGSARRRCGRAQDSGRALPAYSTQAGRPTRRRQARRPAETRGGDGGPSGMARDRCCGSQGL